LLRADFGSTRVSLIALVLKAIDDALGRVKISIILPKLIENRELLAQMVTDTQYSPAIGLIDDFIRRREIILKLQRPPLADHRMIKIIDFFQLNHKMFELFPGLMNKMSINERKLLSSFEMLRDLAERRLERDAYEHIKDERRLQAVYKKHCIYMERISQLQEKIKAQKRELREKVIAKIERTNQIEKEMNEKKVLNDERVQQEMDDNRRKIREFKKKFLETQEQIIEELKTTRIEYAQFVKINKVIEKQAKDEKNKSEIQLESIIRKYDAAIREKKIEILELEEKVTEARKDMDKFMKTYRKEEKIYTNIVIKYEKEEARKMQQMLLRYMMNRAARIIQKYWRQWRISLLKKNRRLRK
ncbi:hypothetical protein KR222_004646, partial [Zaprionus bogoriensis]